MPLPLTVEEARQLGPKKLAYRVGFELANRSGLAARLHPVERHPRTPRNLPSFDTWWANLPNGHWLKTTSHEVRSNRAQPFLTQLLTPQQRKAIQHQAQQATQGRMPCFSKWQADYQFPINWHRNPRRDMSWPADVHASRIYKFEKHGGDIKNVWELNRFPHLYTWVRVYALEPDSRWPAAFAEQLKSWEAANPYRGGANWASGQELAIRALAWVFAVSIFGHDEAFTHEDFQRLLRLLYLHAEHIRAHINYARLAVHNNHLIGEALALFAIGRLFPFFPKAKRWERLGKKLLLKDGLKQFYQDGGYCQNSHTYHRLALHYYIWALRLLAPSEHKARAKILKILERSGTYLQAFMNPHDGRLPNWGANDGALMNPWTACDYGDFRPLLTTISYLTKGERAFPTGPWDEELFWFMGAEAATAQVAQPSLTSASFPTSGLHVVRQSDTNFAVLRCGSMRDRFGQADQLHTDIWLDGHNIAQDGGSYCYNDELQFHRWFVGTASHNTVAVDGRDQMLLHRRFKWLYWTKAKLLRFDARSVHGEHSGYVRHGVLHRRQLTLQSGAPASWHIEDHLIIQDGKPHSLMLHWLLLDGDWQLTPKRPGQWELALKLGSRSVRVTISAQTTTGAPLHDAALTTHRAVDQGNRVEGWVSRYYGYKEPALGVQVQVEAAESVRFVTKLGFRD